MRLQAAFTLLATTAALSLVPVAPLEAGVLVLNNGKVFVGRIRAEEDTKSQVTLRWPYKQQTHRGKQVFEHGEQPHHIRWHKRNDKTGEDFDQPTDRYWEKFGDLEKFPIDSRYMELYERWRIRQKRRASSFDEVEIIDDPLTKGPRLAALAEEGNPLFAVNRPEGWGAVVEDEITIFQAKDGLEGYPPRIHIFAGPKLKMSAKKAVAFFERQMAKAAEPKSWKILDRPSPRTRGSGYDYSFTSRSTVRGRNIVVIRRIFIREKHTYFYAAYCHEKEAPELRSLFVRCAETIVIAEDKGKQHKPKKKKPK
jgi:hypothetical protein